MANRTFATEGFWDRVNEAIKQSGKSKYRIADEMGINRKALYVKSSTSGADSSWHSGRLASFCKVTGVSADWLLGLSPRKELAPTKKQDISFTVIDKRTGKEPLYDFNHMFKEKWFKESNLIYCDLDSWCITEDGNLILTDDCGNVGYPPQDRYEVAFL